MATLDLQIRDNADDIRHIHPNVFQTIIAGGFAAAINASAMRFPRVTIPQGARIDVAHFIFTPDATESGTTCNLSLTGHAADDSAQIVNDTDWHNVVDANLTIIIPWNNVGTWTVDVTEQSIDFSPVVQQIVNRTGFRSGNAMNLLVGNNGSDAGAFRRAFQHDDDSTKSVTFHVEFTPFVDRGAGVGPNWLIYR